MIETFYIIISCYVIFFF